VCWVLVRLFRFGPFSMIKAVLLWMIELLNIRLVGNGYIFSQPRPTWPSRRGVPQRQFGHERSWIQCYMVYDRVTDAVILSKGTPYLTEPDRT
jgi:hypothetical protein